MERTTLQAWISLPSDLAIVINVLGATPAVLGGPSSEWFESLQKPALFPPNWAFGVVWTLLFTLMGVAVYLIVREGLDRRPVSVALGLFAIQFAFNIAWTPVFFALERPLTALGVIVVLDALLAVTIVAFARVERVAATLLVPYLLWALFATLLNYQFIVVQ
jgi:tryptophan-rich sensory protein